jgi:phosphate transport system permease protein
MMKQWFESGVPWVWLNAAAVAASMILVFGLIALIAARGLQHFWPDDILDIQYNDPAAGQVSHVIGEIVDEEQVSVVRLRESGVVLNDGLSKELSDRDRVTRYLVKTGNRDVTGQDFHWLLAPAIQSRALPQNVFAAERREWGDFYGFLKDVKENGQVVAGGEEAWAALTERLARALAIHAKIEEIEKHQIGEINYELERLRLRQRRLELEGELNRQAKADIQQEKAALQERYQKLQQQLTALYQDINRDSITAQAAGGQTVDIPLAKIVRVYQPNAMGVFGKLGLYFERLWEFLSAEPREANTEGGIFPAIFGTVFMVIIMSIIVTPFGVIAAVYLREYAKQGALTRLIRIAVNNLAGVPSIVYGVFGLGFFVYFLGGSLDQLFFPEALPAPTFGTPGIMWASLTLALLTLPVVIVATEEGLSRIPKSIREGSLALGATKAETLWRTVLPMASPAMMTGLILAVARAAGEVAPLMLVGVVKLAPSLPLDGNFPFVHLERKFMHLGFHIYDVGFQSPNVEAARPLVYATALLLVVVIVILNLAAVSVRNHLREKYRALEG